MLALQKKLECLLGGSGACQLLEPRWQLTRLDSDDLWSGPAGEARRIFLMLTLAAANRLNLLPRLALQHDQDLKSCIQLPR